MCHQVIFNDHAVRKQAILDYRNIGFTQLPYWIERGVGHELLVAQKVLSSQSNRQLQIIQSLHHPISPGSDSRVTILPTSHFFLATNHSACINFCPLSQPVSYAVSRSASQSNRQSVSQSASQSTSQSVSQLVSLLVSQPASKSTSLSVSQSVSQLVNQSVSQSASQSVSQSESFSQLVLVSQSVNQPVSELVSSQSVIQSEHISVRQSESH